jgi:hypothetical protein
MKFNFQDSFGMKYTFEFLDKVDQLEVSNPDVANKIIQVRFSYSGYCDGVANVSLKDDLSGLSWLSEEARHFISKIWKNRAFM